MQEALSREWPETVDLLLDWPGLCPRTRVLSPLVSLGWAEGLRAVLLQTPAYYVCKSWCPGVDLCWRGTKGESVSVWLSSASCPVATLCKIGLLHGPTKNPEANPSYDSCASVRDWVPRGTAFPRRILLTLWRKESILYIVSMPVFNVFLSLRVFSLGLFLVGLALILFLRCCENHFIQMPNKFVFWKKRGQSLV